MSLNIFSNTLCSGDAIPLKLTFTNKSTGIAYDLTGSTVGATVKPQPDDNPDTSEALWWKDVPGDTTGVINFVLGPFAAGDYWFDVKIWNNTLRTTILSPIQIHIIQSVTSRQTP